MTMVAAAFDERPPGLLLAVPPIPIAFVTSPKTTTNPSRVISMA